jgi:hypothetical protein
MKKTIVAIVAILTLYAIAVSPSYGQAINGCYKKKNGQLRILTNPGDVCRPSEVAIQWNETGDKGDPGEQGPAGEPGEQGPAGDPARRYVPGVMSVVDNLQKCANVDTLQCDDRDEVVVAIPDETVIMLKTATYQDNIETRSQKFWMYRPPRTVSACPSHAVEIVLEQTWNNHIDEVSFCVSPDSPVYDIKEDGTVDKDVKERIDMVANYAADSLIRLELDPFDELMDIFPLSDAIIISADSENGPDSAELVVTIRNMGDVPSNYLVTVTGFTGCVEPVVAQWSFLEKDETRDLSFALHRCDNTGFEGGSATITLLSENGHIYDSVPIIF